MKNNKHLKIRPKKILPIICLALVVAFAGMIGVAAKARSIYMQEVENLQAVQDQLNTLLATPPRIQEKGGQVVFRARSAPFSVTAPADYKFLLRDDSVVKRVAIVEVELVRTTQYTGLLDSTPQTGSVIFRAHSDEFKSSGTVAWVKTETANQIDTSKLTTEDINGNTWQVLAEPNDFSGHKLTYFLLKDGVGYRVNLYQVGNWELFTESAKNLMNGIKFN